MNKYILKNISKYDVNLGDLRIKIPVGRSVNLLKSRNYEDIIESEAHGSISKKLNKSLIKVENDTRAVPSCYVPIKSSIPFPSKNKSSIIIEVGEIDEDLQEIIMNDDEEYLKQLQMESDIASNSDTPLVVKEEKED